MDAAFGMLEKCGRLPHVFQPAIALLALYGHPRGINLLLQGIAAFELLARPELDRGQSQGQPFGGHRQAGVHQDAANRIVQRAAFLIPARVRLVEDAHPGCVLAMKGEFGGVVQHQDHGCAGGDPLAGGLKMTAQNLRFADSRVGEKPVRCLGVRPILTRPRDAPPDVLRELCQQLPQSRAVACVIELATRQFAFDPTAGLQICQFPLFLHGCSSPCFATFSEVLTLRPNLSPHLALTVKSVLFVGN